MMPPADDDAWTLARTDAEDRMDPDAVAALVTLERIALLDAEHWEDPAP